MRQLNEFDREPFTAADCAARQVTDAALVAYLARIGIASRELAPTLATLEAIQRAHVRTLTFENLSMHDGSGSSVATRCSPRVGLNALGVPDAAALRAVADHVVVQRRGGVCFELNALLCWALRALGFRARLNKAHINQGKRGEACAYNAIVATHAAVLVRLEDGLYYVDGGVGPSPLAPLRVPEDDAATTNAPAHAHAELCDDGQVRRHIRVVRAPEQGELCGNSGPWFAYEVRDAFGESDAPFWRRSLFSFQPWTDDEAQTALQYVVSNEKSWFVRCVIAIKSRDKSIDVLQDDSLRTTRLTDGQVTERSTPFEDADAYRAVLRDTFDTPLETLGPISK